MPLAFCLCSFVLQIGILLSIHLLISGICISHRESPDVLFSVPCCVILESVFVIFRCDKLPGQISIQWRVYKWSVFKNFH